MRNLLSEKHIIISRTRIVFVQREKTSKISIVKVSGISGKLERGWKRRIGLEGAGGASDAMLQDQIMSY